MAAASGSAEICPHGLNAVAPEPADHDVWLIVPSGGGCRGGAALAAGCEGGWGRGWEVAAGAGGLGGGA